VAALRLRYFGTLLPKRSGCIRPGLLTLSAAHSSGRIAGVGQFQRMQQTHPCHTAARAGYQVFREAGRWAQASRSLRWRACPPMDCGTLVPLSHPAEPDRARPAAQVRPPGADTAALTRRTP